MTYLTVNILDIRCIAVTRATITVNHIILANGMLVLVKFTLV
jgi:hypothetical protein